MLGGAGRCCAVGPGAAGAVAGAGALAPAPVGGPTASNDAAAELVDPPLKLSRFATHLVETRVETRHAALDLGQGLGRPAIGCLDLGQQGRPAPLNLLLHPQDISAEPVEILVKEGSRLRSAPHEQGEHSGGGAQAAPPPPRRHSERYCLTRKWARRFFAQQPSVFSVQVGRSSP